MGCPSAGVGIGMLRGRVVLGVRFSVSGCLVSWFLGFFVSEVSKIYQHSISCLLLDIDPISNISKNILDGPPGFSGARLFQNCHFIDFQNVEIYKHNMFQNVPFYLDLFLVSGCLQR